MKLRQGDITTFEGDAIVNAANSRLIHGGGPRAISLAAGPGLEAESRREVRAHGPIAVGDARVTGGYDLPAAWIIHAVGPIYGDHGGQEAGLLARAYASSLDLAREHQMRRVAFPAISAGTYGNPLDEAARARLRVSGRGPARSRSPSSCLTRGPSPPLKQRWKAEPAIPSLRQFGRRPGFDVLGDEDRLPFVVV